MKTNRKHNTARNFIWGFLNKALNLFAPFLIRTIIIKELGVDYVGLNALFTSILQTLSLADLGFGLAVVYSLYKPLAQNDTNKVCALLTFYKKIYRVIGIVIFIIGLAIYPFLDAFISGDVNADVDIHILYLIYLFGTVISYLLFAYKTSLLDANQRLDVESKIVSVVNICMYITQIILLISFKNYYIYAICGPVFTIVINIIRCIIVDKMFPQYKDNKVLDKSDKKSLIKNVKALFLYKLGGVMCQSVDGIIVSSFLGITILAIYNNYFLIISSVAAILTIYYTSLIAPIGNSTVTETVDKNYDTFKTLFFIQSWIVTWFSTCFLYLCQPFMKLWVGDTLMLDSFMVLLFMLYFYVWRIGDTVGCFKEALGLWHKDRYRPILEGSINLVLNILLVNVIGIYGVMISTIIAIAFFSFPWMIYVLYKNYFKRSVKEYYCMLLKYIFISIIVFSLTYLVCNIIQFESLWLELLYKLLVCILIPNALYFLIYFRSNRFKKARTWILESIRKK